MTRKPIYIEQEMAVTMTDLMNAMQHGDQQAAWDLRLTSLNYLPESQVEIDENTTERHFTFTTRLGFGHTVSGEGVCTTVYNELKESVTSTVEVTSAEKTALLKDGSGYQKAAPTTEGVRFSTSFDYNVRHGMLGKLIDTLLVRPYVKWATAYSFDALRMWLRHGVHPRHSWRRTRVQALLYVLIAVFTTLFVAQASWLPYVYTEWLSPSLLMLMGVITAAWINSAELPRARNCTRKRA